MKGRREVNKSQDEAEGTIPKECGEHWRYLKDDRAHLVGAWPGRHFPAFGSRLGCEADVLAQVWTGSLP